MNVIVLGAGLVGGPMAVDLAKDGCFNVAVADKNDAALNKVKQKDSRVGILCVDLSDAETIAKLLVDFDLVINAVPGFMGFNTLRAIIEAKRNVVDIAFSPEDCTELDSLAKEMGVTAIIDCGVAPGMSNILTGYAESLLDSSEMAITYVGGLPEIREWPYEYKAVFSPIDVIEEYTRPARFVENGCLVVRPALSEPELLHFPGVGTLEAFNSDGLRTMIKTIEAPNRKEKTLRYIGHAEKIAVLRDSGLFDAEEIDIDGVRIKPIDFTSKILFDKWKLQDGEPDLTIMKVLVEGENEGERIRYCFDLIDRYDLKTDTHSMARTTGYTATMAIRLMAEGLYRHKGVIPPEFLGRHKECVEFMLDGLRERGVVYQENIEYLAG